jgi:hypothetical protein
MPELQIALDKVCYLIVEAREFDVQEAVVDEDDDSNAIDDDFRSVLEAHEDDATFQTLKRAIDDLNEDEQVDLVALAWVGRGDFSIDEWTEAVSTARSRRSGPTSLYLLGIPVLSDYLEEGLAAFGLSCSD